MDRHPRVFAAILFLAVALLGGCARPAQAANATVLRVGSMYSSVGYVATFGPSKVLVGDMWAAWENARGMNATLNVEVRMFYYDVRSNASLVAGGVAYLMNACGVAVLVAPEGPLAAVAIAAANAIDNTILVLSGMSGDDTLYYDATTNRRRHPNLIGTMSSATSYPATLYSTLANAGARTVLYISTHHYLYELITLGSIVSALDNYLVVLGNITLPLPASVAHETADMMAAIAFAVAAYPNVDLLVVSTVYACNTLPAAMRAHDYNPGATMVWECLNSVDVAGFFSPQEIEDMRFMYVPTQWSPALYGSVFSDGVRSYANMFPFNIMYGGGGDVQVDSPLQFARDYAAAATLAGVAPQLTSLTPTEMACYYIVSSAVALSGGSVARAAITVQAQSTYLETFLGLVNVNAQGLNTKPMVQLQLDDTATLRPVYPPTTRGFISVVYPAPRWGERSNAFAYLARADERAVLGIAVCVIAAILVLMGCMIAQRANPEIRASSLLLVMVMCGGCVCGILSVLAWLWNTPQAGCSLRFPSVLLALSIVQWCNILKAYRIYRIFASQKITVIHIRNRDLLLRLGGVCAAVGLWLAIWAGVAPLKSQVVAPLESQVQVADADRISLNYLDCVSAASDASTAFVAITIVYIVGVICCSLALAMRINALQARAAGGTSIESTHSHPAVAPLPPPPFAPANAPNPGTAAGMGAVGVTGANGSPKNRAVATPAPLHQQTQIQGGQYMRPAMPPSRIADLDKFNEVRTTTITVYNQAVFLVIEIIVRLMLNSDARRSGVMIVCALARIYVFGSTALIVCGHRLYRAQIHVSKTTTYIGGSGDSNPNKIVINGSSGVSNPDAAVNANGGTAVAFAGDFKGTSAHGVTTWPLGRPRTAF